MTTNQNLLKNDDTAKMIGVAPITLRIWRCNGKGPKFRKLGTGRNSPVVYELSEVEAWLAEHTFQSTAGYSPAVRASAPTRNAPIPGPWQRPTV